MASTSFIFEPPAKELFMKVKEKAGESIGLHVNARQGIRQGKSKKVKGKKAPLNNDHRFLPGLAPTFCLFPFALLDSSCLRELSFDRRLVWSSAGDQKTRAAGSHICGKLPPVL